MDDQTQNEAEAPDLSALLNWDGEADLPEPLKPFAPHRDLIKGFVEKQTGEVAARAQRDTLAQVEAENRRRAEAERGRATKQEEIDFADAIGRDIVSTDEAVRTAAQKRMDENRDRYERGMALKYQTREEETHNAAVTQHYNGVFAQVQQAGLQPLIDFLTPDVIQRHSGNVLLASVEWAKQQGEAAGYARGLDEGQRMGRINDGQQGQQAQTGGGTAGSVQPLEKFNGSNKGAGARQIEQLLGAGRK